MSSQTTNSAKRFTVVANWKSCGNRSDVEAFFSQLRAASSSGIIDLEAESESGQRLIVCPPVTLLPELDRQLDASCTMLSIGAQCCSGYAKGAYTGGISAEMLAESGCNYVIVGHSERRKYFGETDETRVRQAKSALDAGLTPIICIGEASASEDLDDYMTAALQTLKNFSEDNVIIAYEPEWAIGGGAEFDAKMQARLSHAHKLIRTVFAVNSVLYGGSVNGGNVRSAVEAGFDGVMIGRASLDFRVVLGCMLRV